jgi:GT2 family glycosyltransferase
MAEAIAVVVVTYNRKKLLAECLDAILAGTRLPDKIILVDNGSTDNTSEFLKEAGYIGNLLIDYIRLPENTGGAGGFYEGVKYGYEAGYDWLWLMDDDAEPEADALEKLGKYLNEPGVSALANLKIDLAGDILHPHLGFFDCQDRQIDFDIEIHRKVEDKLVKNNRVLEIAFSSFVGILVNRKAIEKVGFPNKDFFIRGDDLDYCLRLNNVGRILLITDSIILHKEASDQGAIVRNFLGKVSFRTKYSRIWLTYFETRNAIWLRKKYASKTKFYFRTFKYYCRSLIAILLFDDRKFKRLRFLTEAYQDGFKGCFDNNKPKLLYEGKL